MPETVTSASDRQTLEYFLDRAQARGFLTASQAKEIRETWTGDRSALPLDATEAVNGLSLDKLATAALLLLSLDGRVRPTATPIDQVRQQIVALQLRQLLDYHERTQDEYERRSHRLALALAAGLLAVLAWHEMMKRLVESHLLAQALLGGRGRLVDPDRIGHLLRRETEYLLRFADQEAARRMAGKEGFSEEYLTHRAQAYAGTGRGEFYRGIEAEPSLWPHGAGEAKPGAAEGELRDGWVCEYIAVDDDSTCQPCKDAEGYYLPTEGPFPGQVCLGRARCRCRRVLRYLPEEYAKLVR